MTNQADVTFKAAPLQQGCKVKIVNIAEMKAAWAAFKRDDYEEDMDEVAEKLGTILHQHPSGAFTVVFEGKESGLPKGERRRFKFPPKAMVAQDVVPVKKRKPKLPKHVKKKAEAPPPAPAALMQPEIVFDELPPCEPEQAALDADLTPVRDAKEVARRAALEAEEVDFYQEEATSPMFDPARVDMPTRPSQMPKDYVAVADTLASPIPPPIESTPPAPAQAEDDEDEEAAFLRDLEEQEAEEEAAFLAELVDDSATESPASQPPPQDSTPAAVPPRRIEPEVVDVAETVTLRNVGLPVEPVAAHVDDGPRTQVIYDAQCHSVLANAAKYGEAIRSPLARSSGPASPNPSFSTPTAAAPTGAAPPQGGGAAGDDDDDSPQVQIITKSLNFSEMRAKYANQGGVVSS